MTPATRHHPRPAQAAADQRRRAVAHEHADTAYRRFIEALPLDQKTRRLACERLTRLAGAQIANDHGEGAMHSALSGAVVAGAPAYEGCAKGVSRIEAVFGKTGDR